MLGFHSLAAASLPIPLSSSSMAILSYNFLLFVSSCLGYGHCVHVGWVCSSRWWKRWFCAFLWFCFRWWRWCVALACFLLDLVWFLLRLDRMGFSFPQFRRWVLHLGLMMSLASIALLLRLDLTWSRWIVAFWFVMWLGDWWFSNQVCF